jgi:hypothetical protein
VVVLVLRTRDGGVVVSGILYRSGQRGMRSDRRVREHWRGISLERRPMGFFIFFASICTDIAVVSCRVGPQK